MAKATWNCFNCGQRVKLRGWRLCEECHQAQRAVNAQHRAEARAAGQFSADEAYRRAAAEARFWAQVHKDGPVSDYRPDLGPCWLWEGRLNDAGYGVAYWQEEDGHSHYTAYRVAYVLTVGPIPEGLELDHLCRTRPCVRPFHLEPVTGEENQRRGREARSTFEESVLGWCNRALHPLSPESVGVDGDGRRFCRMCERDAA